MTILQIVPALRAGGVETGTVDLARALVAKGHRALVISSGGPLVKTLKEIGALHYTLPVHRKLPWRILGLVARVAEVVESHGVDLIHARSRVPAIIGYLAWRRVASKADFRFGERQRIASFITTAHGVYAKHPISAVMGWGRLVIAISERIARHMIDVFHVPSERVRLIPRGVDLSRFPWQEPRQEAPKGQWRIVSLGRITPLKGHRDLLKAFQILLKTFPRATLSIVGEALPENLGYLKELKRLCLRLEIGERVQFPGHEPEVPKLLRQMDLLVLASTGEEGFGRVLLEAGACGVPVVATSVGGTPEVVVDRKTGLLVPPADPMSLASAMKTLLKDRTLALRMAKAARQRVEALYPLERMVDQTLEVYRQSSERLRILVIKLSAIGDVALVTPSLRALRARFPKAHLTVLVGSQARELLHRCPYLDDLVVFDRNRDGSLWGLLRLGRKLRLAQVDLVIDFQNNRISHWLGLLSGAPQRYGYADRRFSGLLTHRVAMPDAPLPPVQEQFRLLKLLGIQEGSLHLELWPGPTDQEQAFKLIQDSWVAESQPLVAIHPGGHPKWLSKRWPLQRYVQLVDQLAFFAKARVILTGSQEERELGEEIYRRAKAKPILAVGLTSLNELAALFSRVQVFVGGDSAPLHLAAAMGVPLVALFGSTDPVRHLPPSDQVKLLKKELPCSPCYHRVCYRIGSGYMECMKQISVEEVLQAVLGLLKAQKRAGRPDTLLADPAPAASSAQATSG